MTQQDWLLYNRVGATLANSGRPDEALQYYYTALELNPAYIRARFNLGISCINLRRYDEAAQHILDALVLQDGDSVHDPEANDKRGVTSSALWDSLKTCCLHMQRLDLATLCDRRDLEGHTLLGRVTDACSSQPQALRKSSSVPFPPRGRLCGPSSEAIAKLKTVARCLEPGLATTSHNFIIGHRCSQPGGMLTSPTITLKPTGAEMPQIGFGTWKHYGEKATEAVYTGLKVGYRLIDCACDYGNEKECGEGLKRALEDGVVAREDVWVVSKLWNTFHRKERVREAVMRSLADWGVSYFDIYYVHFRESDSAFDVFVGIHGPFVISSYLAGVRPP
ncbi:hypothetical protein NUW54_g12698 [Trametes sanguinea]|uniref:Uncharacterized protein n=1 Tax=Trametes sanguinea TaxID=158606 RepID=A0ACC1MVA6_9APHY|nr:hypothetical protein NUW54_g12698 [Trametes sanguinea]